MSDTQRQLDTIYGKRSGNVRLSYIDGDPSFSPLKTHEWYSPNQRKHLTSDVHYLAKQFGNVYASQVPHNQKHQTYATALPSNIIWVDDVGVIDCSMLVETSPNNHQAYFCVDRELSADKRRSFARRMRVFYGGDDCSSDAVHNVRVVGAFNTKKHQRFEVGLKAHSGKIYRLEEFDEMLPPMIIQSGIDIVPLDLDAVNVKRENIKLVLARLNNTINRYKQRNQKLGSWYYDLQECKSGAKDKNWSNVRHDIVYGLSSIGFVDDEVTALLHQFHDNGWISWGHLEGKAADEVNKDITACLYGRPGSPRIGAIPHLEQRHAERGTTLVRTETSGIDYAATRNTSHARKDRPQTLTPEKYFSWLRENAVCGVVLMTAQECADVLKVNVRTIRRLEQELIIQKRIEARAKGRGSNGVKLNSDIIPVETKVNDNTQKETGHHSGVSPFNNADLRDCDAKEDDAQTYIDTQPSCGVSGACGVVNNAPVEYDAISEDSGSAAQAAGSVSISTASDEHEQTDVIEELSTLPELISAALDSLHSMKERASVERVTNLITSWNVGTFSDKVIAYYYTDVLREKQYQRSDEKLLEKIVHMSLSDLRKCAKAAATAAAGKLRLGKRLRDGETVMKPGKPAVIRDGKVIKPATAATPYPRSYYKTFEAQAYIFNRNAGIYQEAITKRENETHHRVTTAYQKPASERKEETGSTDRVEAQNGVQSDAENMARGATAAAVPTPECTNMASIKASHTEINAAMNWLESTAPSLRQRQLDKWRDSDLEWWTPRMPDDLSPAAVLLAVRYMRQAQQEYAPLLAQQRERVQVAA